MLNIRSHHFALAAVAVSVALVGCDSSSSSSQPGNSQNPNTQGPQADGFASACPNPIPLDVQGWSVARAGKVFGQRTYDLVELDSYVVNTGTNSSFSASAASSSQFDVKIGCHQVASDQNMSSNFSMAQWINGATKETSSEVDNMSVAFTDGQLVSTTVSTQPSRNTSSDLGEHATSADRQEITGDEGRPIYLSYRIYTPSADTVEMRIEFESDENGTQMLEYGRAVFRARATP